MVGARGAKLRPVACVYDEAPIDHLGFYIYNNRLYTFISFHLNLFIFFY